MNRIAPGLLLAICVVAPLPVSGAERLPERLRIERVGRERGVPSDTITALALDHAGFLWIGTQQGLGLYDGYAVQLYEHVSLDPSSLSDNSVRTIRVGRDGAIWVGTNSGGLDRLDPATGKVERFRSDSSDPTSLSYDSVYAILEDRAGRLWVGTQIGLNVLEPGTRAFRRLMASAGDPTAPPVDFISALHEDRDGNIWIATVGGGVAEIDPSTLRCRSIDGDPADRFAERSSLVFAIAEDRDGTLWFGAEPGLYRLDADRVLRRVPVGALDTGGPPPIVTSLAVDEDGTIWLGTWERGLAAFDPRSGASRLYRHRPDRPEGPTSDRVVSVLTEPGGGGVWVGTFDGGLGHFRPGAGIFEIPLSPPPAEGVRVEVRAIHEDPSGGLWVGTWGKGLLHRTPVAARFDPVPVARAGLTTPEVILSLAPDSDGTIWAGSTLGLYRVDPGVGFVEWIVADEDNPAGLGRGYVTALRVDSRGTLWVGTGGGGLHSLSPGTREFRRFRNDPTDAESLSEDYVTAIAEDARGTLWISTRSGGLNAMDRESGRCIRIVPDPANPEALGHHHVLPVFWDGDGTQWVGTSGGGLAQAIAGLPSPRFRRITEDTGLASNDVVSAVVDDDGSLWLGTRRGLSRYDPRHARFANYGTADGLSSTEFAFMAAERSRDLLYFGTNTGLVVVRRGTAFEAPGSSPTRIRAIRTLKGPLPTPTVPWNTSSIEVPYGTVLSFEFAVLDYRAGHRFAYRLAGRAAPWVELGNRREVTFADLSPGRYELAVRGRNADGAWSETPAPLSIRVIPPFWLTWWFRTAMLLSVVAAAVAVHRVRTEALKRRNRELEALQHELRGAYGRLRGLGRRLENAKEEERRKVATELHDQMGQALSAVKINLRAIARITEDGPRGERLADSVTLVDGMIGHVRQITLDLRPPLLEELGLVAALRGHAEGQSLRSGVGIRVEANAEAESASVPPEIAIATFRVVQESIHNALRHAGARSITVSVRSDRDRLALRVHDDGRGFEVPEALARATRGGHLGLLGMRERIEALGGTVEVDSAPGRGTEIRVVVPYGQREGGE